jgi:hypothetical protein
MSAKSAPGIGTFAQHSLPKVLYNTSPDKTINIAILFLFLKVIKIVLSIPTKIEGLSSGRTLTYKSRLFNLTLTDSKINTFLL